MATTSAWSNWTDDWQQTGTTGQLGNYQQAQQGYGQHRQPQPTAEHIEAVRVAQERAVRESEERVRKVNEAEKRARELLISYLDADQRKELEKHNRITVCARSGTRYRIDCLSGRYQHNITRLDRLSAQGGRVGCAHLPHGIPPSDHHLAQLLMLRHCEADFVRTANWS
jgi:hypothetical protein